MENCHRLWVAIFCRCWLWRHYCCCLTGWLAKHTLFLIDSIHFVMIYIGSSLISIITDTIKIKHTKNFILTLVILWRLSYALDKITLLLSPFGPKLKNKLIYGWLMDFQYFSSFLSSKITQNLLCRNVWRTCHISNSEPILAQKAPKECYLKTSKLYKVAFKIVLSKINCWLSKIRSLHIRMIIYFEQICITPIQK